MATCIEVESYGHPGSHPPAIITQDADNRFVTDVEKAAWDAKADQTEFDAHTHNTLSNAAETVVGLTISAAGSAALLNGVAVNEFSTDATLSGESNEVIPTEKAVKDYVDGREAAFVGTRLRTPDNTIMNAFQIDNAGRAIFPSGVGITQFSADATLANDSDLSVPTERAVKGYVDTEVAALEAVDTAVAARFTAGISQTLTFTGGATGAVATMTLVDGLVTAVTLVP